MHRILIALAVLSLCACSGSSSGSSSGSGSATGTNGATTTGTSGGNGTGTSGSSGASCTNTITSPASFTESCITVGLDGTANADGGASLAVSGQGASGNPGETLGFFVRVNDQTWSQNTFTEADSPDWFALMNDGNGSIWGRGETDTYGSFTLDITSASDMGSGSWELHGTFASHFSMPLPDAGAADFNVSSQF